MSTLFQGTGYFCGECGKECDWQDVDYGVGGNEYWGAYGTDVNVQRVSDCCEGDIFEDPELTNLVHFSKD